MAKKNRGDSLFDQLADGIAAIVNDIRTEVVERSFWGRGLSDNTSGHGNETRHSAHNPDDFWIAYSPKSDQFRIVDPDTKVPWEFSRSTFESIWAVKPTPIEVERPDQGELDFDR